MKVIIDPNVRVRGNLTYAGFEDVEGALADLMDDLSVEVVEPESGMYGVGEVVDVNIEQRLVYLKVDWANLKIATVRHFSEGYARVTVATHGGGISAPRRDALRRDYAHVG